MTTGDLKIRIDVDLGIGADSAHVEEATAQLRSELLQLDVNAVERPTTEAPPGTRAADVAMLGSLVVGLAPAVMPAAVRSLESWVTRQRDRNVKVSLGGDTIELSGASEETERQLVDAFLARHSSDSP